MIDLDILVILDRSGSMQDAKSDHEGGLRSFVEDQRSLAGEVRFTLVQFDTTDPCEVVYDRVALDLVTDVTLVPRGGTPLLDAMGLAIAHLKKQQALAPAAHTLVMVVTDGEENSSHEWSKAQVKALVDELEKGTGKVLYLGANVDAFAEAGAVRRRACACPELQRQHRQHQGGVRRHLAEGEPCAQPHAGRGVGPVDLGVARLYRRGTCAGQRRDVE
jgi:Mg-chelatase subunit ChlD